MFCPGCGIEEKQFNQFCRACGTDLRPAQKMLEIPDQITASADTAREQIGRAFAAKIREAQTAADLKIVAEDVLPQIEKFLESPAEKRLRRMRSGMIVAAAGLGATILLFLLTYREPEGIFMPAAGLIAFLVGVGIILNGLLFTVPKTHLSDKSSAGEAQRGRDALAAARAGRLDGGGATNELVLPEARQEFVSSVTEQTTRHLHEKDFAPRK
ncbi:MAG: hypothetical protein JSS81_14820 [Acidobacteria bacterium]|nr:hypothetical protein [Acidobacteriota bacterium]